MTQPAPLSALLRKENDAWVLQCLDFDIAVEAGSIPELKKDFERVLNGHIMLDVQAGRRPLQNVPPAPEMYWDAFRSGLETQSFRLRVVEPVSARPRAKPVKTATKAQKKAAVSPQVPMPWMFRSVVAEMRVA